MNLRRPYLLAAVAALGAIVAYIEFANTGAPQPDRPVNSGQAAPRTAALSQDAAAANRPPGGNPLWALPLKQLSNTRERPIFSPSRRPPPPATPTFVAPVAVRAPPPKQPERPPITLLGTILGSTESIGVFFNPTTRDIVRLRVGEDHSGWALFSIKTREATLVKDRQRVVLEMPPPGESGGTPVNDFSQPPPGVRPAPAQRQQRR
jgi:general secretion pathway protein N